MAQERSPGALAEHLEGGALSPLARIRSATADAPPVECVRDRAPAPLRRTVRIDVGR